MSSTSSLLQPAVTQNMVDLQIVEHGKQMTQGVDLCGDSYYRDYQSLGRKVLKSSAAWVLRMQEVANYGEKALWVDD